MKRLLRHGYIDRAKQFAPVGGGGQWIYRLTRAGHLLVSDGEYVPARHFVNHSLGIGEVVVALHQLERTGALEIVGIDFEPDSHTQVGGAKLKPDLYVYVVHSRHGVLKLWVEVDMATQGHKRLMSKLRLYQRAYHGYTDADAVNWPEIPRVLWVTIDSEQERTLNRLILDMPEEYRKIYRVTTFADLPTILA